MTYFQISEDFSSSLFNRGTGRRQTMPPCPWWRR